MKTSGAAIHLGPGGHDQRVDMGARGGEALQAALTGGGISDVRRTNRFDSALDLEQTLMRYVHLYNTQLPQSALRSRTPMQAMKDWHKSQPHLFVKTPRNCPGCDT